MTTECIAKRLDALLGSSANASTQLQPPKRLAGTRALLVISSQQGIVARAVDNSKVGFLEINFLKYFVVFFQSIAS